MNEAKRRNLPRIREINKEKKVIYEEIERLKLELNELNAVKPMVTIFTTGLYLTIILTLFVYLMIFDFINSLLLLQNILEKRKNDFKTEGEYISKILNRNIKEEFVSQMKRELKQLAADVVESLDQVLCTAIPGCDELNESFDQKGVEGVLISQKTDKFLSALNSCHMEIIRKIYIDDEKSKTEFEMFCYDLICSYFKRRTTRNRINTSSSQAQSVSTLPQFIALLLNDLNVSLVFCSIHFKNFDLRKLKKITRNYFEIFLTEQKEEISCLVHNDQWDKSVKRITLFLSRLEKVLRPLMLKSYFKNFYFILLNYSQKSIWKNLLEISDISVEEIEGIINVCKHAAELDKGNYEFSHLLKYKHKLSCLQQVLNMNLVEIINSYHRRELKEISSSEMIAIIKSVFASTALRNEFIKELEIDCFDKDEEEFF